MANRAGLRKVVKTVRGKHGAVRRSYWVRAQEAGKGIIKKHGGKIAAGALLGAALLAGRYLSRRPDVQSAVKSGRNRMADHLDQQAAGGRGVIGGLLGFNRNLGQRITNKLRTPTTSLNGRRSDLAAWAQHNSHHFNNITANSEHANATQYGMTSGVGTSGWNLRSTAPPADSGPHRRRGEGRRGRGSGTGAITPGQPRARVANVGSSAPIQFGWTTPG